MIYKEYLTIQDAADISNKSVQTIRRAIKAGKLKYRKRKTPQGFNYSVSRIALCEAYNLKLEDEVKEENVKNQINETVKKAVDEQRNDLSNAIEKEQREENGNYITQEDFHSFAKTLEKLISQHADERQNFLRLVNTLQEKIFVLENQINLLKSPDKKWFNFWK